MQTKPCPSCATTLFEDDDFCPKCGSVLDESLLADDPIFGTKTEPGMELPLPPVSTEEPSFDNLLEELTGTVQIFEAAHVMFARAGDQSRVDPEALTRLSSVLTMRAGADPGRAALSPYEKLVLSLLNGNRSVARVAKKSGLGADEVRRAIGVLAERGLIELKGELQPDVRGLLMGEMDESEEISLPPAFAAMPRTTPGVALLDGFADELTAEINPDDDAAPPPMDDAPPDPPPKAPPPARAAPRFLGDRAVLVRAGREELSALWLSNLSKGGLFVESDAPPPAYTAVDITLETPDGSLVLKGEVVHVQLPGGAAPGGAGIQLAPINKDVRERLESYMSGLAPLGGPVASARPSGPDPALLESALAAARTLSNGVETRDLFAALGLVPGANVDAVRERADELRRLFEGPHPAATPPQAARCQNAIRLLATVTDQIDATPAPPPMPEEAPLPVEPSAPQPESFTASASMAGWSSSSSASRAGGAGMPGMPGTAPRPPSQPPSPSPSSPSGAPSGSRPARADAEDPAAPAAAPGGDARRMRAMQLLETAVKELRAGKRSSALTYIRMAAEIAPEDPQVKSLLAAWTGKA